MTETKAQQDSINLSQLISMPGWRLLLNEAEERRATALAKIESPDMDKKTWEASLYNQGERHGIKGLLDWVMVAIEEGK